MLTEDDRLEFHTFIKKFIKQIDNTRDIHIFVFYFGLINGYCYDIYTLAEYAHLTSNDISVIINNEVLKFNSIIHTPNYAWIPDSISLIPKLLSRFPSDQDYLSYNFYKYLYDITYIPIDVIYPFMVKLLSQRIPPDDVIQHNLSSFICPYIKVTHFTPFQKTLSHLSDFMYNSLYIYDKLYLYATHPYFKDFHKVKAATEAAKHPPCSSFAIDFKPLITWPTTSRLPYIAPCISSYRPLRNVNSKIYSPKKKTFESSRGEFYSNKLRRKVYYDSALEFKLYQTLENDPTVTMYCEQPFSIPYIYNSKSLHYIPDVFIEFKDKSYAVVELKSLDVMVTTQTLCKFNALKQFCINRNYGYLMFDGKHTLSYLKSRPLPAPFVTYMLSRLRKRPLYRYDYKQISNIFDSSHTDLLSLIIQHNLSYNDSPFILSLN